VPPSSHLKTETDPASETLFLVIYNFQTIDEVQKSSDSECYTQQERNSSCVSPCQGMKTDAMFEMLCSLVSSIPNDVEGTKTR
jgi:hypothetical protein